jgi:mono/diheme cytochrome c family protein
MRVLSSRIRGSCAGSAVDKRLNQHGVRQGPRLSYTMMGVAAMLAAAVGLDAGSQPFGSAARGREVLQSRACLRCHSLGGTGAGTAPDLGRRSIGERHSPTELAASMWNHGPDIWRESAGEPDAAAVGTATEGDDVLAYFWALRYFDRPGEAIQGKQVFAEKGCAGCHALSSEVRAGGAPAVSEWQGLADPVRWSESLWNHSAEMSRLFKERGLTWPRFTEEEMTDMLVYLQNLAPTRQLPRRLTLSNPDNGHALFEAKGCVSCHTLGSARPSVAKSGGSLQGFQTMTGFTAEMWNHAPEMHSRSAELGIDTPQFTIDEMRAMVSFVYFSGGFEQRGNPSAGQSVYVKKQCASCHGEPGSFGAAQLEAGSASAARMVEAVWSHGPEMLRELERRGEQWPTLSARDVANLVAFLNDTPG